MPGKETRMNANEIVKALHVLCGFDGKSCSGNCAACPADQFRKEHPSGACDDGTMTAASALIESLTAENARLRAERDKAVEDLNLTANCDVCKHYDADEISCAKPTVDSYSCFEWRGTEGKA